MKSIFLIILLLAINLFFTGPASAQYKLETGLPNVAGGQLPANQELPSYINYLFIFGLGLITVLALGQMIIGGMMYILAAGNAAKMEDAKDHIYQALLGLGLLLASYLLLRTVNPDLVNLKNPTFAPAQFKGQLQENEQEIEGAPCNAGEVTGSGRNYAICINGQWVNTSNMLQ